MNTKTFEEVCIGDLLAPDPDVFLLGDRWIVKEKTSDYILIHIYHCGIELPKNNWYQFKILKNNFIELWCRGETLDDWLKKFK